MMQKALEAGLDLTAQYGTRDGQTLVAYAHLASLYLTTLTQEAVSLLQFD